MSHEIPELDVLTNYIGTWDVSASESGGELAAMGTYTTRWILDGRYVETAGSVKTSDGENDFSIAVIITFDTNKRVYRWWSFFSNGHTEESEGSWDEANQTMTRITHYGDIKQTTKSDFSTDGVETWSIVNSDANGSVVSEMSGINTRRPD